MRTVSRFLGAVLAAFVVLALAAAGAGAATLPSGFRESIAFGGLEEPTNFRFAPNGEVFIAEKAGKILRYESLSDSTPEVFDDLRTQVYDNGDRGLLGLAVDPGFPLHPYIYALYTYDHILGEPGEAPKWGEPNHTGDECPKPPEADVDACPVSGRLVRLTDEGGHVGEEKVLVEDWCQQFSSHSIGDLQFGPEGALYASGGDGASFDNADYGQFGWPQQNQCGDPPGGIGGTMEIPSAEGGALRSQDVRTPADPTGLDGTLIRIDPDTGEGLPGNPFASSPDANARRIYAFGFRNPFRFTLDPPSGNVYVDNVGWETYEEMDRFPLGSSHAYNSGWPCYEADGPTPGYEELSLCKSLYAEPGAASQPFFLYAHTSGVTAGDTCTTENGSAITGIDVYHGGAFPEEYEDAVFFGDPVRGCIYVMPTADGEPNPLAARPFLTEGGGYSGVDLETGPEGNLFYASLSNKTGDPASGAIHRVSYDPNAPRARLEAASAGEEHLNWEDELPATFTFDASGSTSAHGGQLEYEWDFNEDGTFETVSGSGEESEQTYSTAENRTVAVKVTDQETGKWDIAKITIYPGDKPPTVDIYEPEEGLTWGVGQRISFKGIAFADRDSEPLSQSGLYWKTRLAHCPFSSCHLHPLQIFPGTWEGELTAPEHDYPSYLEIALTATDPRGLSATTTLKLNARPVELRIRSEPPGVRLTAGAETAAAPFALTVIEGAHISLSAPPTAEIGGVTGTFAGWSDGGARSHTVQANASTEYVARYSFPSTSGEAPVKQPPPRAVLRKHPPKKTASRTARFVFAAKGASAGFRCKLDHGRLRPCHSPHLLKHLKSGKHVFRVYAVDPSRGGQVGAAVWAWRVL